MNRFEANPSRWKFGGILLLCLGFVGLGGVMTTLPGLHERIMGWVSIAICGPLFFVTSRTFLQPSKLRIVMDDDGIATGMFDGVIEWDDIDALRIDETHGLKSLSVFVKDKDKYLDRMPVRLRNAVMLHASMGLSEISLSFLGLTPGLAEACDYLRERGFDIEGA